MHWVGGVASNKQEGEEFIRRLAGAIRASTRSTVGPAIAGEMGVVGMADRVQVSREPKALTKELAAVPKLIAGIFAGHDDARLTWRPDEKTWSASDVLAHLRSSAAVQGKWIAAMLDRDNPTLRAVSPRSQFRKYVDRDVAVSLKEFTEERAALVKRLRSLDEADWTRTLTFTGASPRSTIATVSGCAWGLVQHEKSHLQQFKDLLS